MNAAGAEAALDDAAIQQKRAERGVDLLCVDTETGGDLL